MFVGEDLAEVDTASGQTNRDRSIVTNRKELRQVLNGEAEVDQHCVGQLQSLCGKRCAPAVVELEDTH